MPAVAANASGERAADAGGQALLCACAGLTSRDAEAALAANPAQSFEEFLARTKSGHDCTACMLDLEYFFVETPRKTVAAGDGAAPASDEPLGLKQRLYALLDRLPPKLAYNRSNWMPVLSGVGVEQFLCMANYPLLFGKADDVSDFDIRFVVRDGAGRVVHRGRERLPVNGVLRHSLTQYLPAGADDLTLGSVQVDRFALRSAARGTTRPQTELVLKRSAATLHFQAATAHYDEYLTLPAAQDGEAHYLSVMNCARRPFRLVVERSAAAQPIKIELGAHESRLVDVSTPPSDTRDGLATIHFRSQGLGKLHLVIVNRRLDRISLDHL